MNKKERKNLKRYFDDLALTSIHYWFNKISDSQFDKHLEDELRRLEELALDRVKLSHDDLEHEIEMIISPTITKLGGATLKVKRGKDKRYRYSPVAATLLFFTEHKLVTYQCVLDLFTGNPLNTAVKKFFYGDIVAIETQSENHSIKEADIPKKTLAAMPWLRKQITNGVLQMKESETFILTTAGGTGLKVQMPDVAILGDQAEGQISKTRAERAVAALEKMLDDKKIAHA